MPSVIFVRPSPTTTTTKKKNCILIICRGSFGVHVELIRTGYLYFEPISFAYSIMIVISSKALLNNWNVSVLPRQCHGSFGKHIDSHRCAVCFVVALVNSLKLISEFRPKFECFTFILYTFYGTRTGLTFTSVGTNHNIRPHLVAWF